MTDEQVQAAAEVDAFSADQWWYQELDAVAKSDDQRRAMAVVRNLMRQLEAARSDVQPKGTALETVAYVCLTDDGIEANGLPGLSCGRRGEPVVWRADAEAAIRAAQAPTPGAEVPTGRRTEIVLNELRSALNAMLTFFGMDEDESSKAVFDKARQAYDYAQLVMRPLEPWERQALEDYRTTVRRWHEKAVTKGYDGVESMCDTALPYGTRDLRLVAQPTAAAQFSACGKCGSPDECKTRGCADEAIRAAQAPAPGASPLSLIAQKVREQCAVAAWSAGMDAHNKAMGLPIDARDVGSACASRIRKIGVDGLAKTIISAPAAQAPAVQHGEQP